MCFISQTASQTHGRQGEREREKEPEAAEQKVNNPYLYFISYVTGC